VAANDELMKIEVVLDGVRRSVELLPAADEASRIVAQIDGRRVEADIVKPSPGIYSILLNGRSIEVSVETLADRLLLRTGGREYSVDIVDPRSWRRSRRGGALDLEGRQQVSAPMAGKIVRVLIAEGQQVESGQGLLVVEAMKMQNEIRSPKKGIVERLLARESETVNAGEVLAVIA
jgi:biotin carboxyl carrier protein